jgi:hypothetical protein
MSARRSFGYEVEGLVDINGASIGCRAMRRRVEAPVRRNASIVAIGGMVKTGKIARIKVSLP